MRKYPYFTACLVTLALLLAACRAEGEGGAVADTQSEAVTVTVMTPLHTEPPSKCITDATQTLPPVETVAPTETWDPAVYIVIRTAQDLLALNRAVNADGVDLSGRTVMLLADIDLSGYVWEPLMLSGEGITFDGRGHTVSGMTILYNEENAQMAPERMGGGFVGVLSGDAVFRDITFANAHITAYERQVGCVVGATELGCTSVVFDGVTVTNLTVEGWTDYKAQSPAEGGHYIAYRIGGIMGASLAGTPSFRHCLVEGVEITGFHTLAGILGYDATRTVHSDCFEACAVSDVELFFGYCTSDAFSVHDPLKRVAVFYNAADLSDTLAACLAVGCTYSAVAYYDFYDGNTAYDPETFRSLV